MGKNGNYSAAASSSSMSPEARAFAPLNDYRDEDHVQQFMKVRVPQFDVPHHENHGDASSSSLVVDYMLNNSNFSPQQHQQEQTGLLGFSDVMQFTGDFGPKNGLSQSKLSPDKETGMDPVYFLKFPVLNDKPEEEGCEQLLAIGGGHVVDQGLQNEETKTRADQQVEIGKVGAGEKFVSTTLAAVETSQAAEAASVKNKRKRGRAVKTSEEVESQRMTHIAVERNRRKQMNEHLRVLRSLMPGSYVKGVIKLQLSADQ